MRESRSAGCKDCLERQAQPARTDHHRDDPCHPDPTSDRGDRPPSSVQSRGRRPRCGPSSRGRPRGRRGGLCDPARLGVTTLGILADLDGIGRRRDPVQLRGDVERRVPVRVVEIEEDVVGRPSPQPDTVLRSLADTAVPRLGVGLVQEVLVGQPGIDTEDVTVDIEEMVGQTQGRRGRAGRSVDVATEFLVSHVVRVFPHVAEFCQGVAHGGQF